MCQQKEPHFFSQDRVTIDPDLIVKSEAAYLRLFEPAENSRMTGEASPSYLWHPEVPTRIKNKSPNAKVIAILRDPIGRAYSQYLMDIADGLEAISFYDAILRDQKNMTKVYGTGQLYIELGFYAEQIRRYLDVFGPEQVLVVSFDTFSACTRQVVRQVISFLGLDPSHVDKIDTATVYNRGRVPRNALVQQLARLRILRRLYRSTVPVPLRVRIRDRLIVARPKRAIDPRAVDVLQTIYTPQLESLDRECGITMPELKKAWREMQGG